MTCEAIFTLNLRVEDLQALHARATISAIDNKLSRECIEEFLGTREKPNIKGCLIELLDPGSLIGCSIHDSDVELFDNGFAIDEDEEEED